MAKQLRVGTNLERTGVQLWHPFQVASHNTTPASRDPNASVLHRNPQTQYVATHREKKTERMYLTKYSKNTEKDIGIKIFGEQWV